MSAEQKSWRCFHCDEVFTDYVAAKEHFGAIRFSYGAVTYDTPACQIDPQEHRRLIAELAKYENEDSELQRAMAAMQTRHAEELRKAEEAGYAKGLRDGNKPA